MRASAARAWSAALLMLAVAACNHAAGTGFVQIKTVPVSAITQPALYLDSAKLEPLRKAEAVITRKVGTSKLQTEGPGGQLTLLCDIVVKKNRVTTVTISIAERPPRCQCASSAGPASPANRTCVG